MSKAAALLRRCAKRLRIVAGNSDGSELDELAALHIRKDADLLDELADMTEDAIARSREAQP